MPRLSPYTTDKQLSALFATETEQHTQSRMFKLVTLTLPGDVPLYLVDSNYSVTFDGIEYAAFPLKVAPTTISTDGSIDKASITVANVSREMMTYVEQYNGMRGCRVQVKSVYESVLDFVYFPQPDGSVVTADNAAKNNTAYIEDEFFIDTYSANEQAITFTLEPIIDLNIRLPRRRYMVDTCYWTYKGYDTCKHNGVSDMVVSVSSGNHNLVIAASANLPTAARRLSVGTIISIGNSYEHLTIATSIATLDSTGKVTGWTCTVSPTPAVSAGGYLKFITCNKTLTDCAVRKNVNNFGGFPGVSGSRRILL